MQQAYAEEGLWPIDRFPAEKVRAAYGVEIGSSWSDHVMRSSLRLSNGCSASIVSAAGLVMTDNHCVAECLQGLPNIAQNAYAQGFLAAGKPEPRCEGLTAEVLAKITDVTSQVEASGQGSASPAAASARELTIARLEREGCPASDLASRCQVVAFFGGGQYKLMKYRVFEHVGLVFAAGEAAAAYGPDADPPYFFDAAFLRLYAGDRPAATPDHLAWSSSPLKAGDLVFTAGSPRLSERQLTISQLETERSVSLPVELVQSAELKGRLIRFGEQSAENERSSHYQLDDLNNHYEYIFTLFNTLNDPDVWARKLAEESEIRGRSGAAVDRPYAIIERAERRRRELAPAYETLDGGPSLSGATSSQLFAYARILVEGALERAKPPGERSPRYADARLPAIERRLFDTGEVYRPLEELQLEAWLSRARDYAPPADPTVKLLLGDATPQALAAALSLSKLNDVNVRRALWSGGAKAVAASDDPMIRLVLRIEPATQLVRSRWKEEVSDPEAAAAAAIGRARIAASGTNAYPDANRTLRISFGRIEGVQSGERRGEPFTTLGGLYAFAAANPAYPLSPQWSAAKGRLAPDTIMNLLSTNDTINGNSGSPLLNSRGEVVGLFGGGDAAAESGDYAYEAKTNRAYSLSAAAIIGALDAVYGDKRLVAELTGDSAGSVRPR